MKIVDLVLVFSYCHARPMTAISLSIMALTLGLSQYDLYSQQLTKTQTMKIAPATEQFQIAPEAEFYWSWRNWSAFDEPEKKPAVMTPERIKKTYMDFILMDNPKMSERLARILSARYYEQEAKYGLVHGIIPAIIKTESNHRLGVVSNKDAHGLMQIQRETGREWARKLGYWPAKKSAKKKSDKDLLRLITEPTRNVDIGAKVLDVYIDEADGNIDAALARYSGGARNYATKVKNSYQEVWALAK